jgi:hypothetical protein
VLGDLNKIAQILLDEAGLVVRPDRLVDALVAPNFQRFPLRQLRDKGEDSGKFGLVSDLEEVMWVTESLFQCHHHSLPLRA